MDWNRIWTKGIFLSSTHLDRNKIRFHKFWRFLRSSVCKAVATKSHYVEQFLRRLQIWRRLWHEVDHPCYAHEQFDARSLFERLPTVEDLTLHSRSEKTLDTMWVETSGSCGYFSRDPRHSQVKFAFTNFGVSYGLQAWNLWPERVEKLNNFFNSYKSRDEYDTDAITHVMHLNSLLPGVLMKPS